MKLLNFFKKKKENRNLSLEEQISQIGYLGEVRPANRSDFEEYDLSKRQVNVLIVSDGKVTQDIKGIIQKTSCPEVDGYSFIFKEKNYITIHHSLLPKETADEKNRDNPDWLKRDFVYIDSRGRFISSGRGCGSCRTKGVSSDYDEYQALMDQPTLGLDYKQIIKENKSN